MRHRFIFLPQSKSKSWIFTHLNPIFSGLCLANLVVIHSAAVSWFDPALHACQPDQEKYIAITTRFFSSVSQKFSFGYSLMYEPNPSRFKSPSCYAERSLRSALAPSSRCEHGFPIADFRDFLHSIRNEGFTNSSAAWYLKLCLIMMSAGFAVTTCTELGHSSHWVYSIGA